MKKTFQKLAADLGIELWKAMEIAKWVREKNKDNMPDEVELHNIWFESTGTEIGVIAAKGLRAIYSRLYKE